MSTQKRIVGTEPKGLVVVCNALFELAEMHDCSCQEDFGVDHGRLQRERAFPLLDRFIVARVDHVYVALNDVSEGVIWIEGERFRHQVVRPFEVGLGIGA